MQEYVQDAGATSIDIGDLAGTAILLDGGDGAICYPVFRGRYLGIHRGFCHR